ncbi:MAG: helix-turn-helix transcriptional regulator [Kiritimatiellia bacterium]
MKWSDELTENRREVNYTIREAGEDVILCLLADCPLRITGTPDVVSVTFTGQKIIRAETEWERAVIAWEGGETDDEGLVRLCSPDVFRGRGAYLRQDLNRMVREYRHGTRKCHTLKAAPAAMPEQGSMVVGRIEKRLDVLTAAMQQCKTNVPIPDIAKTLRREMEPMLDTMKTFGKKALQAVTKQTEQTITDLAPHFHDDQRAMLIKLLKKSDKLTEIERKAALLAAEGMKCPEIALRLPFRAGKPRSREAVRQLLLKVQRKTGTHRLFAKGTYSYNEELAEQARKIAAQQALDLAADEEESTT